MRRIRLLIALLALVATTTLGLGWTTGMVQAEGSSECNCIDGFSKRDGVATWDPVEQRVRCATVGCYVITE
jgi:hypothetical protein